MKPWTVVCRVDDIPVLGARRVARDGAVPVAVFRTADDRVFALLDRCPHKGGPLSQGIVFGDSVACPLHNWTIGLADGCARAPDEGCTTPFACKVAGRPGAARRRSSCAHGPSIRRPPDADDDAVPPPARWPRPVPPAPTAASAAASSSTATASASPVCAAIRSIRPTSDACAPRARPCT